MSDNSTDDDTPNDSPITHKTLLKKMKENGVEEFDVTLELDPDLGPDAFRVVSIEPKARK